jgi:hypothetical protein
MFKMLRLYKLPRVGAALLNTAAIAFNSPFSSHRPVIIDGIRTPFLTSGSGFKDVIGHDLQSLAIMGLLEKTNIDPGRYYVI